MSKGRRFGQSVILLRVSWHLTYRLSLRDQEEMVTERGIAVDHTTIHRWTDPATVGAFNPGKVA
jgi:putative transposase